MEKDHRLVPGERRGQRNPQEFAVNVNFTDARMFMEAVNSVLMGSQLVVNKIMGSGGEEKYRNHQSPGDLMYKWPLCLHDKKINKPHKDKVLFSN